MVPKSSVPFRLPNLKVMAPVTFGILQYDTACDSDLFQLGCKRSYNSNCDSMFNSFASENQTLVTALVSVLSVRFELCVSLLLAPVGGDKRGPRPLFLQQKMQEYSRQFARDYPPELRRKPGLTENTEFRGLIHAHTCCERAAY